MNYPVYENQFKQVNTKQADFSKKVVTFILASVFLICLALTAVPFYEVLRSNGTGTASYNVWKAFGKGNTWYGGIGGYSFFASFAAVLLMASKSDKKKIVGGYIQIGSLFLMMFSCIMYVHNYTSYYHRYVIQNTEIFSAQALEDYYKELETWASPGEFAFGKYSIAFYILVLLFIASIVLAIVQHYQRKGFRTVSYRNYNNDYSNYNKNNNSYNYYG